MFVPNPFRTIQIANISSFYLATCAKAKTTADNTGESHLFVAHMGFFLPCFDKCTSIQIQETLVITLVPYTRTCFSRVSMSGWNFPWKGKGLLLQWLVLLPELPSGQLLSDPCSSAAQLGYQQTQGIQLLSWPTTSSFVVKWVGGLWEFLSNRHLNVAMLSGIFCLLWSIPLGV